MRYEIRRASGDIVTPEDTPGLGLEVWRVDEIMNGFFVEVPPGYSLERICEATHHKLIVDPFDKVLTIYDDYVE